MRSQVISRLLLALAVAALFGCAPPAGIDSFERGLGLEKQHRYEDAISMFEEAIAKEPTNTKYSDALNETRHALVGNYLESAKSFLEGKTTFEKLTGALNEIDKALALEPANGAAKELSASVKSQMEGLTKRADDLYLAATRAVEAKSWTAAVDKLTEIGTFYPNYLDLAVKLPQVREDGAAFYLKEAERLRAAENFSAALTALTYAQKLQPDNPVIAVQIGQLKEMNTPKGFLAKAQAYVKRGECDLALESIRKAKELRPSAETLADLDKLLKEGSALQLDKSRQDLEGKNLFNAYNDYLSALRFDAGATREGRTLELRDRLVGAMLERAEAYEAVNRLGNALTWQEKALKLETRKDIVQKMQAIKERLRQRVVKKIALMDFTSPSTSQDAGRIVTDNLLSYLTRNSSGDMKILARDVLGTLLKEIELGQAGLYDIESAKKGGKLKGTDVFIFGSVLNYNVEKNVDEGLKMVNAVVGTKTIPNPDYQEWQNKNRNPSDRERAGAPPQTIKEEIREIVKYKVATHKKTANVSVSFRVIDVEEGEVIITKTLKKKLEATDTYSEGVEFANIPFKELKLPSDSELLEQVVDSVIAELGYAVLSRFQNLQVLYSNSAELLKTKGDPELVIERYTDAIIAEEVKNSQSQITEKARNEIELQLKALSVEKVASELSQAERAAFEKAPQMKIPLAVKLPPDPSVTQKIAEGAPAAVVAPAPAVAPGLPPVAPAAATPAPAAAPAAVTAPAPVTAPLSAGSVAPAAVSAPAVAPVLVVAPPSAAAAAAVAVPAVKSSSAPGTSAPAKVPAGQAAAATAAAAPTPLAVAAQAAPAQSAPAAAAAAAAAPAKTAASSTAAEKPAKHSSKSSGHKKKSSTQHPAEDDGTPAKK